ncbi:hypothetical protein LOK49_LG03G02087 [Camellia lanceoleosa]|uniref:Uncharacterized protein n=1 Tax=Camellia lanceoleosa TaxID=1840588 RepID=A0ACC0IAT0_9ERIC|nr:hypothetical protein LOK49_LG03G02087 [Camellia lanceoleosa]
MQRSWSCSGCLRQRCGVERNIGVLICSGPKYREVGVAVGVFSRGDVVEGVFWGWIWSHLLQGKVEGRRGQQARRMCGGAGVLQKTRLVVGSKLD